MGTTALFGYPEEWQAFTARNAKFFEAFPRLHAVCKDTVLGTYAETSTADRVILFLGRLCLEDMMEVLLLAGNGYGFGAMKLIRGMYERAVAAAHIAENPEKADDFLSYARIEKLKAITAWTEAYPDDDTAIQPLERAKRRAEEVKDRFPRPKYWSGLDFVAMAKKTGALGKMLTSAYYQPLAHAHGTAQSVVARLIWSEQLGYQFDGGPQHKDADEALKLAHKIMLYVLATQIDQFHTRQLDAYKVCTSDFVNSWKDDTLDNPA